MLSVIKQILFREKNFKYFVGFKNHEDNTTPLVNKL